jgi:hypothetical protein
MDSEKDVHAPMQYFALNYWLRKMREYNWDTHLLFLDYEKSFDSVQKQIWFNIFEARSIPDELL